MSDREKLIAAVVVLVGSLSLLTYQVRSHFAGQRAPVAAVQDDGGMTSGTTRSTASIAPVAWIAPDGGLDEALRANPFLLPAGKAAEVARATLQRGLDLQGVRTGSRPLAIINDRTVEIGETVAGWQLVSVDRHRVTLRDTDGTTVQLTPPHAR